jgi:hypothetical protein
VVTKDQDGNGEVSRSERARWVARYRASGLGLKRFAAEHGLLPGQLHYWVYDPVAVSSSATIAPVFREVRLSGSATSACGWAAEVMLSSGVSVRLREGTAPEWAGALIQALGGLCSR